MAMDVEGEEGWDGGAAHTSIEYKNKNRDVWLRSKSRYWQKCIEVMHVVQNTRVQLSRSNNLILVSIHTVGDVIRYYHY